MMKNYRIKHSPNKIDDEQYHLYMWYSIFLGSLITAKNFLVRRQEKTPKMYKIKKHKEGIVLFVVVQVSGTVKAILHAACEVTINNIL